MSSILFSHSYYYQLDPKQWKNKMPFPPLGTLYAAALLRENHYEVGLFDTNLLNSPNAITSALLLQKPKYLVIYDDGFNYLTKMCLTTMREACFEMIAIGKKHNCTVIVCSSDATDHYADYLGKGADYCIQGEGELTLLELITALDHQYPIDIISGIVFQKDDTIITNPKRAVFQDLDSLPLPAWDLVAMDSYKSIWAQGKHPFTLNIATTRGCPFKCNWCAKPIYGNRYNSHSPEYIANHIEFLKKTFDIDRFWMCDDIFGLKPNWVQEFKVELQKRNLKINYYIQSRVDLLLKEDTIDALVASGLREVWVGAESGSQKILDAMDKGTTLAQIYEATQLLKAKKVQVAFFLQFGYLGETQDDIAKTIAMVKELVPDNIGVSVSYPLPGTPFYEKVKTDLQFKANWKDSDDLEMLFQGTFKTNYYRKLQRYVHKEYRKSVGFAHLKSIFSNPLQVTTEKITTILKLGYYIPSAFWDSILLKKLQHEQ